MAQEEIRTVVLVRPSFGGVGHVAHACAEALRSEGIVVDEVLGPEGGSPALDGLRTIWAERRAVRAADVVHVELGRTALAAFWLGFWASLLRRDLVVVLHDGEVMVNAPGSGMIRTARGRRDIVAHQLFARLLDTPLRRWLARRTAMWVVLSERSEAALTQVGFGPVTVVSHGADRRISVLPPSGADTVVYAGYFSEAKGFDLLVDCWIAVGASTGLRLVVAGTRSEFHGPWTDQLRERLLAADPTVIWIESPDDRTFHATIAEAAVVVVPYRSSNPVSGIVVRAAVEGRAVLGTDVPAVVDTLVNGESAYVVEAGSVEGLADGLMALGADPALRDRLGEAAARWAEEHATWEGHADGLLRAYRSRRHVR